jgi:hypothetical protein
MVALVGVGRGHDMFDPVCACHATHFVGHLPGFRPVVDVGKNVAMDVNHEGNFPAIISLNLSRLEGKDQ